MINFKKLKKLNLQKKIQPSYKQKSNKERYKK